MKLIDEKGKLFSKINIIDFVIILAVILLAVGSVIKFTTSDEYMSKDTVLEYTILVENVRQSTVDAINQNKENIVDYESKKELGNIVDVKISGAKELQLLTNGEYKEIEFKDKYDILLTIETYGTDTENSYYTKSGKKLVVGDIIKVYNEFAQTSGMIRSIKVK